MNDDPSITLESVGAALAARAWRLAFAPPLERRFEADTAGERCRKIIRHNYIGLAIYDAFMLGDYLLVRDIIVTSIVLHLAVMTPVMLAVNAVVARRPPKWLRESLLAGGIVLATAAILALTLLSRSPLRSSEHISAVLVILFATMVQRIRLTYVLAACLVSLALYVAALSQFAAHDMPRVVVAIAVFAGVVLFSIVGCRNLESELRAGYLLSLRDRLRNEELERISRIDPLTGVGNRRALDSALERLHAQAAGEPARLAAVLLVDIDFFKSFNDANGHLAGDGCLREVARSIAADSRIGFDRVFRFGGEEFLVIVEGASAPEVQALGEDIRRRVQAAAIKLEPQGDAVVTVSIGTAIGHLSRDLGPEDIMAEADAALYTAKHRGRNLVCSRAARPAAAARKAA